MTPQLSANLLLYSAQLLALVGVAALASSWCRLTIRAELTYWRGVLLLCFGLPLIPAVAIPLPRPFDVFIATSGTAVLSTASGAGAMGSLFNWLPMLWLLGALLRGAWLAVGFLALRHLGRDSVDASTMREDVIALRDTLAPRASLRWHDRIRQPATFGCRRPVIVLPRELLELTPAAQRAIVCHELLHVARHDWLWLLIEEAVRTIFWCHPGIRWAVSQLQLRREQRIDELVVGLTSSRRDYMCALVAMADIPSPSRTCLAFIRQPQLHARLSRLAAPTLPGVRLVPAAVILVCVTVTTALTASTVMPLRRASSSPDRIYSVGDGVLPPAVVGKVRPPYPPRALASKVTGTVILDCVVTPDGTPAGIRIVNPVHAELDLAAQKALAAWRFHPGTKNGLPVPVRVAVQMTFTLK